MIIEYDLVCIQWKRDLIQSLENTKVGNVTYIGKEQLYLEHKEELQLKIDGSVQNTLSHEEDCIRN